MKRPDSALEVTDLLGPHVEEPRTVPLTERRHEEEYVSQQRFKTLGTPSEGRMGANRMSTREACMLLEVSQTSVGQASRMSETKIGGGLTPLP